jgi:hypothetical protein
MYSAMFCSKRPYIFAAAERKDILYVFKITDARKDDSTWHTGQSEDIHHKCLKMKI